MTQPRIGVAVMHVPDSEGRKESLDRLLRHLRGMRVLIASDRARAGRWRNHRRALEALLADHSLTHVMILPDDAQPVPGFSEALPKIVAARPEEAITLFCGRPRLVNAARSAGGSWARTRQGIWGWCVLPRHLAREFLDWEAKYVRPEFKSDDARLALWSTVTKRDWWATVPSVIEQDESVPSSIGHGHKSAINRRAIWLAHDAMAVDWSKGIETAPRDGEGTLGKPSARELLRIRALIGVDI